jgi:mono/diheme cytochrome c family protein
VNEPDPKTQPQEEFRDKDTGNEVDLAKIHGSILREQQDPKDGNEPVPLWLVTLSMALIFWGGLYIAYNSGGFRADVFNPSLVSWTGGGEAAAAGPPDPMVLGRRIYTQNCLVCHQASGAGVSGQFPPLADSEWVTGGDWVGDNHLVKLVLHGLQGPVTVKGQTYNNVMTPWADVLNDQQIAAVLTYIRNEWGNTAPPVTPEFVAKVRAESEGRREPFTQATLREIPAVLVSEFVGLEEAVDESNPPSESSADADAIPEA